MSRFPEKRIVITGAASGLGRSLSYCYATMGWRVAVTDIDVGGAAETLTGVERRGGSGFAFQCDVSSLDDFLALSEELIARWQGIDIVINNAGIYVRKPTLSLISGDWQQVLDVNLMGVVRGCTVLARQLVAQRGGHLVNISSAAGLLPPPKMAPYSASKAAIISLSETLVQELAPFGVGVSVVCPSYFESNMHTRKIGGGPNADEIADIVYREVEANRFMIVPHAAVDRAWREKLNGLLG